MARRTDAAPFGPPPAEGRRHRNGKRLTLLLAAPAVTVLALAGCGSSSPKAAPTTTTSTTAASTSTTTGSSSSSTASGVNTSAFLGAIHTQHDFDGLSDANMTKLGQDVCADFNGGADLTAVENDAVKAMDEINANDAKSGNNGSGALNQHDAGFLIGASVKALCPQYQDQLNA